MRGEWQSCPNAGGACSKLEPTHPLSPADLLALLARTSAKPLCRTQRMIFGRSKPTWGCYWPRLLRPMFASALLLRSRNIPSVSCFSLPCQTYALTASPWWLCCEATLSAQLVSGAAEPYLLTPGIKQARAGPDEAVNVWIRDPAANSL